MLSEVRGPYEEMGGCGDGDTGVSVFPIHMAKSREASVCVKV